MPPLIRVDPPPRKRSTARTSAPLSLASMAAAAPAAEHASHAHAQPTRGDHEEVVATYRFTCAQPAGLNQLEVRAFAQFPRLRELRVEHATARGQGAAVLTPAAAALAL